MADGKSNDPEWAKAAREVGSAVGGASKRLVRGLRDLTRRPEDDDDAARAPTDPASPPDPDADSDDDLGDKMRELGRDFVDVMGRVSVTAGKKIRKAAWGAADAVRDSVKKDDDASS